MIVPHGKGRAADGLPSNWEGGPLELYINNSTSKVDTEQTNSSDIDDTTKPFVSQNEGEVSLYHDCWDKRSVALVVERRNLSEDNLKALLNLRVRMQDIEHPMNCAKDVARFLIARSGNVDAAEAMFRKSMAWREKVGADTILQHPPPQPIIDNVPGALMEGCDKDGDPIFIERFISADAFGILNHYGKDALMHHAIWLREFVAKGQWIQDYERKHEKSPGRITVIVDLEGLSRRHAHRNVIQAFGEVARLDQDNYPEGAKRYVPTETRNISSFYFFILCPLRLLNVS